MRGPVVSLGLVFFVTILCVSGTLPWARGSKPCSSLLPLVGYIVQASRPHQPFPVALKIGRSLLWASSRTGLPLYLLVALAQEESSFNPSALNPGSEDYGLFQVHYPFWEKYFRKKDGRNLRRIRREDLMEISVNTRMAMDIVSYDLKLSRGDVVEMLGRYSGRTGEAQRRYVQQVLRYSLEFKHFESQNEGHCPGPKP